MTGSSSSGFSGSMDSGEKVQDRHDLIRRIWDFFETLPFERMKPRQDLVDNGYCLAEEGREYLVYLDKAGKTTLKLPQGSWKADWINAQDLRDVRSAGQIQPGQPLATPADGDDWLLRVRPSGR